MSPPPQGGEHEKEFLIVLCPSLAAEETNNGDSVSLLLWDRRA
jgi:hypothetical protein